MHEWILPLFHLGFLLAAVQIPDRTTFQLVKFVLGDFVGEPDENAVVVNLPLPLPDFKSVLAPQYGNIIDCSDIPLTLVCLEVVEQ